MATDDLNGDCFADCQMFFDFGKVPNLKAALKGDMDPEAFRPQPTSKPFPIRGNRRISVKVVDVYGSVCMVVREL